MRFTAKRAVSDGIPAVTLTRQGGNGDVLARIAPSCGFNLYALQWRGEEILHGPLEEVRRTGFTGTPILYPTPNRVRGSRFIWRGKTYRQEKNGVPRLLHGLVYDEAWQAACIREGETSASVTAAVMFDEAFSAFGSFPFPHRLSATWILDESGLRLCYAVENRGEEDIPYGFAIHPYFRRCAFGAPAQISMTAPSVFESDGERFPTGRVLSVAGTRFDLREARAVETLDLDDVYTGMSGGKASVDYGGHRITLHASPEFGQMVVYTPPGAESFCLENQTCMTDAHNQAAAGREPLSGLLLVPPGGRREGWIHWEL